MNRRIVIDGNDGTGKSTLVRSLRLLGFSDVHDRGEMSEATLDPSVQPDEDTTYIWLHCDWKESRRRLVQAGKDLTERWHTDEALQHFDERFHEVALEFGAHPIQSKSPQLTLDATLLHMGTHFTVGLATGRLQDKGASGWGYPFNQYLPDREMVFTKDPFTFVRSRTKAYPKMVALGTLDLAVVGSDVLQASPYTDALEVVSQTPQKTQEGSPIRVCISSLSGEIPRTKLLRVVTPFTDWAQKVFGEHGFPHAIYEVSGGSEGLIKHGLGDVLFDIVETGNSLRSNDLQIVEDLGPLNTCIIRRKT